MVVERGSTVLTVTFVALFVNRHEQEKSQGASENGELRRRIKQLEEENEEMSDNRLQLIGKSLGERFFLLMGLFHAPPFCIKTKDFPQLKS